MSVVVLIALLLVPLTATALVVGMCRAGAASDRQADDALDAARAGRAEASASRPAARSRDEHIA